MTTFILSLLFGMNTWAADSGQNFSYYSPKLKKTLSISLVTVDKLKVSEKCLKKNCQALLAASSKKKFTYSKAETPFVGNPAAVTCNQSGGETQLIKDKMKKEYDICIFKDGSAIDSWDLHYSLKK